MRAYIGGTFDRFHKGHKNLISRVKNMGYDTIVVVNSDDFISKYKANQNVQPEAERWEAVSSYEDTTATFTTDKETQRETIEKLKPDVIVIGTDWLRPEILPQLDIDEKFLWDNNIGLLVVPRTPNISSTEIRNNE